jgi:hypothetical protein
MCVVLISTKGALSIVIEFPPLEAVLAGRNFCVVKLVGDNLFLKEAEMAELDNSRALVSVAILEKDVNGDVLGVW